MPRFFSEPMSEEESGKSLDRLVAFSDGVFAIAMTLLVLNLTVPTLTGSAEHVDEELWRKLRDQWPELFSYALSFWVIGRFWLVHHRMFRLVRRADGALMTLNLLLLGFIALIPWPTEMLGRYGDTTTAVVAYSTDHGLRRGVVRAAESAHATRRAARRTCHRELPAGIDGALRADPTLVRPRDPGGLRRSHRGDAHLVGRDLGHDGPREASVRRRSRPLRNRDLSPAESEARLALGRGFLGLALVLFLLGRGRRAEPELGAELGEARLCLRARLSLLDLEHL